MSQYSALWPAWSSSPSDGSRRSPVTRLRSLLGMVRIAGAALLIGLSLLGLAAIGLFISTLTDVPVGAMAATLGVFILVGVLDALPQVRSIHPWLFTNDWQSYGDLLRTHVQWASIIHNLLRQAIYVVIFGSAAWARFTTKDVLA